MILSKLTRKIIQYFNDYLNLITFFIHIWRTLILFWNKGRDLLISNIVNQIIYTGLYSLTVMTLVSLVLGGMLIFICNSFGLTEDLISRVIILIIFQHVGPLLTMIILIGRSGTAIAAELGNMKITHETEALEMMGIDTYQYIVAPRVIGMTISIFCLNIFVNLVGVLGGAFVMVTVIDNFSLGKFYQTFFSNITVFHIIENLLKVIGFGFIISTVACYQGLQVERAVTEVPRTTTMAVGRSIALCFLFYAYITIIFIL